MITNYGPYHFQEKLIPLVIRNALDGKPLPIYGNRYTEALKEAVSSANKSEEKDISNFANTISNRQNQSLTTLRNYWNSFK